MKLCTRSPGVVWQDKQVRLYCRVRWCCRRTYWIGCWRCGICLVAHTFNRFNVKILICYACRLILICFAHRLILICHTTGWPWSAMSTGRSKIDLGAMVGEKFVLKINDFSIIWVPKLLLECLTALLEHVNLLASGCFPLCYKIHFNWGFYMYIAVHSKPILFNKWFYSSCITYNSTSPILLAAVYRTHTEG